jgi:hypothetical protein
MFASWWHALGFFVCIGVVLFCLYKLFWAMPRELERRTQAHEQWLRENAPQYLKDDKR